MNNLTGLTDMSWLLAGCLADNFGREWTRLTEHQQRLVLADLLTDPDLTIPEYRRCIGAGNLLSYVKCLEVTKS